MSTSFVFGGCLFISSEKIARDLLARELRLPVFRDWAVAEVNVLSSLSLVVEDSVKNNPFGNSAMYSTDLSLIDNKMFSRRFATISCVKN